MNHADTFQPPHNTSDGMPDGKAVFGFVTGLIYLALMTLSCFWALVARKGGTLGTRAYWFDFLCANTLLLFLRQSFHYSPCYQLFTGALLLMSVLFVYHFIRTMLRKEHVHRHCVGTPLFGGRYGELLEWIIGGGSGLAITHYFPEALPFGVFLVASSTALAIRSWMIKGRDHQRVLQMEDAIWEQNQLMNQYEGLKK